MIKTFALDTEVLRTLTAKGHVILDTIWHMIFKYPGSQLCMSGDKCNKTRHCALTLQYRFPESLDLWAGYSVPHIAKVRHKDFVSAPPVPARDIARDIAGDHGLDTWGETLLVLLGKKKKNTDFIPTEWDICGVVEFFFSPAHRRVMDRIYKGVWKTST